MNGRTTTVGTLLFAVVFGLVAVRRTCSEEEPSAALVALETLLHGNWDGLGCDGEMTFRADGTYEARHVGPSGWNSSGTWDVRWDALPPTLVLARKTSDAPGYSGTTLEVKIVELDKARLVFGFGENKRRARYERAKAIDEAKAISIAKAIVADKETWADRAEYTAKRKGEYWSILVWRMPKTPGGHRTITLTREGKLIDYLRGR